MYRDNKMDSIQIEYTYEEALIKIPRFGYNGGNYIAVYREKEYCCHINENGTVIIFFDKKATETKEVNINELNHLWYQEFSFAYNGKIFKAWFHNDNFVRLIGGPTELVFKITTGPFDPSGLVVPVSHIKKVIVERKSILNKHIMQLK